MNESSRTERERLRQAFAPGKECLSAEQIEAVLEDRADPLSVAHAADCARCAMELRLLRDFREAAPGPEEAADVAWIRQRLQQRAGEIVEPSRRVVAFPTQGTRPTAWALAAAAMVLLGVALGTQAWRQRAPEVPAALRDVEVLRSGRVVLVAPAGDVPTLPATLEWQPVAGAVRYEVRVMEVDRTEIWKGETASTSTPLPEDVKHRLRPGKTVVWQVTARAADGLQVAVSDRQGFRINP